MVLVLVTLFLLYMTTSVVGCFEFVLAACLVTNDDSGVRNDGLQYDNFWIGVRVFIFLFGYVGK